MTRSRVKKEKENEIRHAVGPSAVRRDLRAMMHMAMFMKNVSMMGAALIVTQIGSGPLSLEDYQ